MPLSPIDERGREEGQRGWPHWLWPRPEPGWCRLMAWLCVLNFWGCGPVALDPAGLQVAVPVETASLLPKKFVYQGNIWLVPQDPELLQEIRMVYQESSRAWGMAAELPADLPDSVQSYLQAFTTTKRGLIAGSLSRGKQYFPMMRRIFREQGIPPGLIYLAIVESGLNPTARSPKGAVGLWQFMADTARRYGLKVDDEQDDRQHPERSTRAAARYLRDLFAQFGSWHLALAGYNAGEGRVAAAIRLQGSRNFWVLAENQSLPAETRNYVPQLLAVTMILKNPEKYGFQVD